MTRADVLEELRRETEYLAEHTKAQYFAHAMAYLDYVKNRNWRDRDILYNYTQLLKKRGMSQDSINYQVRGPIGALFRAHGLRIPIKLPKSVTGKFALEKAGELQFNVDEIRRLIAAARDRSTWERAVFALATVYGPRLGEIQGMLPDDVNRKRKTVLIRTLKGGMQREHMIPPQIQSYLLDWSFMHVSRDRYYSMFRTVAAAANVPLEGGKSFHAIRHGLAAALLYEAGLERDVVKQFMRWRDNDILGHYAPYDPNLDQKVFAKHPFLADWV